MNTFQLSCFLAVAENLNFARAAKELNISQPAVTHQIRSLEEELNVKLFRRNTRLVELTYFGNLFLNDAREILTLADRAKKRLENLPEQEILPFSIGCGSAIPMFLFASVLREMARIYPGLRPQICTIPFASMFRLLDDEAIDAAAGFEETDSRKVRGTYRELKKIPVVCLCAKDSPLAGRGAVSLADLREEKIVLTRPLLLPNQIARLQNRVIEGRSPSDLYFCESVESCMILAKAGMGVTILPEIFALREVPLAAIPVSGTAPISFGLYYKTLQSNGPLKDFIRLSKEHFQSPALS